jgi:hypothetical protein
MLEHKNQGVLKTPVCSQHWEKKDVTNKVGSEWGLRKLITQTPEACIRDYNQIFKSIPLYLDTK